MTTPATTRRRFLHTLGLGAVATTLPMPLWADDVNAVTISILHTTDLHGHILPTVDYNDHPDLGGLARCATQIRQWRHSNPNSLLIDIGDVYQGTEVGLRTRGATMIRCLNALNYDAWVVGNHEFDWGLGPFAECVAASSMPVLSGNALVEGKPAGTLADTAGPLARLRPWLIKDIAGFRVAVISLTTPALATWIPPEDLSGVEMRDPVETLRHLLAEVAPQRPDAILLAGHMGLTRRDDYANRVGELTREFPQLVAFIGGHTHQNHSAEEVNGVLYTQADHFGIYAGKVDLTFDRDSRKLLQREAVTVPMDHRVPLDPLVLSLAQADLAAADLVLAHDMGELVDRLDVVSSPEQPSDVERLIASAIVAALRTKGVEVDFVAHGLFDDKHPLLPGRKTVADAWSVLPYENEIVTVEVTREDLDAIAREFTGARGAPHLMAVKSGAAGPGASPRPSYRLAVNSYDSQSGGQRFLSLARLVASPSAHRMFHPIQTRDALIDFFVTRQKVGVASMLV